jgi:hypothetical protein
VYSHQLAWQHTHVNPTDGSDAQETIDDGIHHQADGIHVRGEQDARPGFASNTFL